MERTMPEMKSKDDRVAFGVTGWKVASNAELPFVDMHFHTNCSDSYTDVNSLVKLANKRGVGVAITDHNLISTLTKIDPRDVDGMLVPGMEISTTDGPHILVYFYEMSDLKRFWSKEIRPRLSMCPWLALRDCPMVKLMDLLESENCVVSSAHPMGYFHSDKGAEACHVMGRISEETVQRLDAYEVLCSGMSHESNLKALDAAIGHGLSYTGGTDGHLLFELGNVVTQCDARDLDGFLDCIVKGGSKVIGREKTSFEKLQMGCASFSKFVEHAPSSVVTKLTNNTGKSRRGRI